MSEYVECYENLKAAVVKLAADDYRRALIRQRIRMRFIQKLNVNYFFVKALRCTVTWMERC